VSPSVLLVARWYPSHDQPGRGTFVADLVAALAAAGAECVVASFETTQFHPGSAHGDGSDASGSRLQAIEAGWAAAVRHAEALARPRSWGAPSVPVARLPVVRTWGSGPEFDRVEQAARHAAVLVPFATSLSERAPIGVIHAHTGLPDGLAAASAADALGVPLLVTEHDSTLIGRLDADPEALAAYRTLLADGRRVVAVSRSLAEALSERLRPTEPIAVLPNPVPIDAFPVGDDGGRIPGELLWVGARATYKGTERLLRAFALVHREMPRSRLRMIGASPNGDDEPWLRLAAELGVAEAVTIEPPADRASVAAAMGRASAFIHPSPSETFGMVAAEALASGLPVAATASGGVDDIVGGDGRAGSIAASLEPEALAAAIRDVLARREEFDPSELRGRVDSRFGPAAIAARTLEMYRDLSGDGTAFEGGSRPELSRLHAARGVAAIVALRRSGLARVASLPPAALANATVVTGPGTDPPALPGAGRVISARRSPPKRPRGLGGIARRLLPAQAAKAAPIDPLDGAVEAIGSVVGAGSEASDSAWLVAADGDDVEAIQRAGGGDSLAPGSLRWLADRDDERSGPLAP
jgi:glycosyltransferase involved in cell wall biosynthesis